MLESCWSLRPAGIAIARTNCIAIPPFAHLAGDGYISEEDMTQTLRYLVGSTLTDEQVQTIISKVMVAAQADRRGMTFKQYQDALSDAHVGLTVDMPSGDGA